MISPYMTVYGEQAFPTQHQGVKFRTPEIRYYIYLIRKESVEPCDELDELAVLNRKNGVAGDPEIDARIAQYEMAFRMQSSVPDLTNTNDEPKHILESYGPDVQKPGTMQ